MQIIYSTTVEKKSSKKFSTVNSKINVDFVRRNLQIASEDVLQFRLVLGCFSLVHSHKRCVFCRIMYTAYTF